MLRVRRGKLPILAAATAAALPTLGFGQTSFNWTFNIPGQSWTSSWNDATKWNPNNLGIPGASISLAAKPIFSVNAIALGAGTVQLPTGFQATVAAMDFVGTGTLSGLLEHLNYTLVGPGTINIATSGSGTIDVTSAGSTADLGYATIAASLRTGSGQFLYKTGQGTLVLSGTNSFGGGLAINNGVVRVTNANSLNGVTIVSTAGTGGLQLDNVNVAVGSTTFGGLGVGTGTVAPINGMVFSGLGDNTWNGSWFLVGKASAGALLGGKLTLNGALIDSTDTAVNGFTKMGEGTFTTGAVTLFGPLAAANGFTTIGGAVSSSALTVGSVLTDTNPISPTFQSITFSTSASFVAAGVVTTGTVTIHNGTISAARVNAGANPITIGRLDSVTFTPGALFSTGSVSASSLTLTSGTLNASRVVLTSALTIGAGTKAKLTANAGGVAAQTASASTAVGLTMATNAQLDLTNNKLTISYAGGPSPAAAIRALLIAGRAGGNWNGANGIMSSSVFGGPNPLRAVGYVDNTGPQNVVIAFTRNGDATVDGTVNLADLLRVSANYNGIGKVWSQGDFTYDGTVNLADLLIVSANYNGVLPGPGDGLSAAFLADWEAVGGGSPVPEPATLGLAALGGVGLLGKRKRRK